jgi:hypothetical protein
MGGGERVDTQSPLVTPIRRLILSSHDKEATVTAPRAAVTTSVAGLTASLAPPLLPVVVGEAGGEAACTPPALGVAARRLPASLILPRPAFSREAARADPPRGPDSENHSGKEEGRHAGQGEEVTGAK